MNYLAPAGTPIKFKDIARWSSLALANRDPLKDLENKIKQKFNINHCLFMSSGRAALYLILECLYELKGDKHKNEVIIPSYTCYSVPGAVEKANLRIRACDVNSNTLSYDLEKLASFDFSRVLAIVTGNLYGIPDELDKIQNIAREHNVYMIDDAAQSMGATVQDRFAGTFGDIGIYSLDKGKNITSIQGGIIVTNNDELSSIVENKIQSLPDAGKVRTLIDCLKLIVYAVLLPPSMYWIPGKFPFTQLGTTPYTTDYPLHHYSNKLASLAEILFGKLEYYNQIRIRNANKLKSLLKECKNVHFNNYRDDILPVYLRLPIFVTTQRSELIEKLNQAGIGASSSYPTSIVDIPDIKHLIHDSDKNQPDGKKIANQIVTLPTHPYTCDKHIQKTVEIFRCLYR
jgi:dTDP-4-amino-4,6-dideoxygalactose transaminase